MHILTYGRQHRNICALKMVQREGKKASKKEKIREKIKNITKLSAPHIFYPDIIFSYFISSIRLKIVRRILLNILPKVLGNGNNITVRTHQRHLAARWGNECIIERKKKYTLPPFSPHSPHRHCFLLQKVENNENYTKRCLF